MNSPRNLLKKGLSIFASLLAESRIKNLGIVTVFCPFYHLVSDEDAPHIRHLYPIKSIADFKEELRLFKEHFEFVSLAEMKEGIELGVKPKCFLSFDDGLKQIYQEIVPILREENIPATFFINPGYIDNKGLMFRYKASLILDKIQGKTKGIALLSDHLETANSFQAIKKQLLSYWVEDVGFFEEITRILGIDYEAFLALERPYLTSKELIEIQKDPLFSIGAHSMTHPLYAEIGLQEQLQETRSSVQLLEKELGVKVAAFAFPFSSDDVGDSFFERIYQEETVALSFGTSGIKKPSKNGRHWQRFPMEEIVGDASLALRVELMYFYFKKLIGKA